MSEKYFADARRVQQLENQIENLKAQVEKMRVALEFVEYSQADRTYLKEYAKKALNDCKIGK